MPSTWALVYAAGLSGMGATCIIQPIDMVKVRLQMGAVGSPVRLNPVTDTCLPASVSVFGPATPAESTAAAPGHGPFAAALEPAARPSQSFIR